MPDRPLPVPTDPQKAQSALRQHMPKALEGYASEYDGDRTLFVQMTGTRADGTTDEYVVRFTFTHYPTHPPSVTFVNPTTKLYDGTHWPAGNSQRLAFHARYGDAPAGMVCNSMTFEYYFWGGHNPTQDISWNPTVHTFAATIAELADHLRPPLYQGRQT